MNLEVADGPLVTLLVGGDLDLCARGVSCSDNDDVIGQPLTINAVVNQELLVSKKEINHFLRERKLRQSDYDEAVSLLRMRIC